MNSRWLAFLRPLSWLYGGITDFWHWQYDQQQRPSVRFDLPVICIGNLTVGGTGKTPHIEYLVRLLHKRYPLAILSRGYGRKTKGFRRATALDTARTIGDEPLQFFKKFSETITVAVGEERILAIPQLLQENPSIQVILLDDGFQHRKIRPSLSLLLCDYHRPFYLDHPFPTGRLRERRHGAKRADAIIVSKCPDDLTETEQQTIQDHLQPYLKNPSIPVYFSGLHYGKPSSSAHQWNDTISDVFLITGIARPAPLVEHVRKHWKIIEHFSFPDHHDFKTTELLKIRQIFEKHPHPHKAILTTEKDMARLEKNNILQECPIFALPVEVYFLKDKENFDYLVVHHIEAFLKRG